MPAKAVPLPKPKIRRSGCRSRRRSGAAAITEDTVQKGVIQYLELLGWYVCHVPAGGKDPKHQGRMRRQGYKAGFPDLYCEPPNPQLPPILIECKRPGERPTPNQRLSHVELRERGREVWVVDDVAQLWEEHGVWPTPEAASVLRERLGLILTGEMFA